MRLRRKTSQSCDSASGLRNSSSVTKRTFTTGVMVTLGSRLTSCARGFFLRNLNSLLLRCTGEDSGSAPAASRVQQAGFQTGWNTRFISQSCHRNSAVVGTTHLPQEPVLVALSDDVCWYKSLPHGEIPKRTLLVHAHVSKVWRCTGWFTAEQEASRFHF